MHWYELYRHRIDIVRLEARATQLAYGFIRNKKRSTIEKSSKLDPYHDKILKDKVKKMILKYVVWRNPLETKYEDRAKIELDRVEQFFDSWYSNSL